MNQIADIINQYGVFFGLKEELSFWEEIGKRLIPNKQEILKIREPISVQASSWLKMVSWWEIMKI